MLKYIKQGLKEANVFSMAYLKITYPGFETSMEIRKKIVEDLRTSIFYVTGNSNSHDYPLNQFASLHHKGVFTSDAQNRMNKFIGKTDTDYFNQIANSSGITCYRINHDGTTGTEGNYLNLLDCCISFKSHKELLTLMDAKYYSVGDLINHVKFKLTTIGAIKIFNIDKSLNFETIEPELIYAKLYNNCNLTSVKSDLVRNMALNSNI